MTDDRDDREMRLGRAWLARVVPHDPTTRIRLYQEAILEALNAPGRMLEYRGRPPSFPVEGDAESAVDPDTVKELVALAKADKRDDFDFLAGAAGVPADRRDELWTGTRARLNKPPEEPREPFYGRGLPELLCARAAFVFLGWDVADWTPPDAPPVVVHPSALTGHEPADEPPQRFVWSEMQDPTHWFMQPDAPPALHNGLRRPPGYRERPRWQDRRTGRVRPWE